MKLIKQEKILKNSNIYYRKTKNYKTSGIDINFRLNVNKDDLAPLTMLCKYLGNCSNSFKTIRDFNNELDHLYGSSLYIYFDCPEEIATMTFGIDYIDGKYAKDPSIQEEAIKFLHQAVFNPLVVDGHFDEGIMEICREVCISDCEHNKEFNMSYVNKKLYKKIFKSDDVSNIRLTKKDFEAVSYERLMKAYNKIINSYYFFCASGYIDYKKTNELLSKYFPICECKNTFVNHCQTIKHKTYKPIIINKDVSQAKVAIAYSFPITILDDDYEKALLARRVLCGSINSKIYHYIREELGLCYSMKLTYLVRKGVLIFNVAVANENVSKVVEEINNQIIDAANGNVTDEQFNNAKTLAIHDLNCLIESKGQVLESFVYHKQFGINFDLYKRMEKYESISKNDVIETIKKYRYMTYAALTKVENEKENI